MMSFRNSSILVTALVFSSIAIGQENGSDSDGFFSEMRSIGAYTEGPGREFFQLMTSGFHAQENPQTLGEMVESSAVVARGSLIEVLPGRSHGIKDNPARPPLETVFFKISPSNTLKGAREDYFLVETPASHEIVGDLNAQIYTGDLLFLARPATDFFGDYSDIKVSTQAEAELANEKPLYQLTRLSGLFTISGSGALSSPLNLSGKLIELYMNVRSLEELESRILSIQASAQ